MGMFAGGHKKFAIIPINQTIETDYHADIKKALSN